MLYRTFDFKEFFFYLTLFCIVEKYENIILATLLFDTYEILWRLLQFSCL